MHSESTPTPPQKKNGNRKNENLANLYQVYHSGDPSDFGDPTKNGSIFDLEIREGSFFKGPKILRPCFRWVTVEADSVDLLVKIDSYSFWSSPHLSKLPGNKQLNFFGEPFYVLPKS